MRENYSGHAQQFFGAKEIKHLLEKFKGVVDLGASDTHFQSLAQLQELNEVLLPYKNVFLILPSKEIEKSIDILKSRLLKRYENDTLKSPVIDSYLRMNEIFIKSESTKMVAKKIIYTENRSVNDIIHEILSESNYLNYETKKILQQVS